MYHVFSTPFLPPYKNQKGTLFLAPCYLPIYLYTRGVFICEKTPTVLETNYNPYRHGN